MSEDFKVICLGDPHFKVNNVPESEEMSNKFVELCQKEKPKIIVVLGDILHRHETIHVTPLMKAEQLIKRLSEISPTFVIVGNHDRPNNSNYLTDEHPFNAMKHWDNTYVVDKVVDLKVGTFRFIFSPYVPPGKFMDALNTVDNPLENTNAIFAHQEFFGAKMGAIISQAGDKWSLDNPLVVSGHIHDYQQLQDNMIYVGTPFQHAFGDSSDKTVSIFRFTQSSFKHERVDLGIKKRVIVYITPDKIHDYIPPEDKLVKLIVKGEESEIKACAKLEKIQELKRMGVKISFKATRTENTKTNNVQNVSYKDRLYQEIKTDLNCVKWFNKLF